MADSFSHHEELPSGASAPRDAGGASEDNLPELVPELVLDPEFENIVERFELAWQGGAIPGIDDFLPPLADQATAEQCQRRRELLEELIKIDLEYRWRRTDRSNSPGAEASGSTFGSRSLPRRLCLEDYVVRFPELCRGQPIGLELVAEEYRVRLRWGDRPPQKLFIERFPEHRGLLSAALGRIDRDSLRSLRAESTAPVDTDVVLARSTSGETDLQKGRPGPPSAVGPMPDKVGRYSIRGFLGRGGFGSVYLGFDEELQRQVAVKVPRTDRLRSSGGVQAFLREARLAAQLRHPALVDVYDVGRLPDGSCYIVMQFIDGQPLNVLLAKKRPTQEQAAAWTARVAEAVHCAHKIGLIHGDLKPANILIDRENRPHVTDFGLAIVEQEQTEQAGFVSGTPAYMAPEQIRGERHRLDGRTDLWSLGIVFYELLTGRRPFTSTQVRELFDEIQNRDPKPPRQIDDTISPDLEWICLRLLSKRVAERYTTGMDLVVDLRQAMQDRQNDSFLSPSLAVSRTHERTREPFAYTGRQSTSTFRSRARPSSFPNLPTSFIGRERELVELGVMVQESVQRLVTVVGPGGMGKTRLALRVGEEVLDEMPGGCWFADLREARSVAEISHTVAAALGVALTSGDPPEQVVANVLEYRKPLLLILDNFEQVVQHAETTIGRWRAAAPHVRFLVTSRSALGLSGEQEYELGPLPIPPRDGQTSPEELQCFDAVRLFCERASEALPGFAIADHHQAVAAICGELEGIPLAVELAAARVKIMKPAQIAQKLGQKFQLLQAVRRDVPVRQQTLWGAIDWSFELLNDWEKQAFMQACVFRGGFTLESAEAVIDLSCCPDAPLVLDAIQSLRDKSLLTMLDTRYEARFGMYASVREYGEQQWRRRGTAAEQQALAQRCAARFIEFGEAWNQKLHGPEVREALDRLRIEADNLWAVQDRALAADDPVTAARAILALAETMAIRGPADQRAPRLERALAALSGRQGASAADAALAIALRLATAEALQAAGQSNRALQLTEEAVQLAAPEGHPSLRTQSMRLLGDLKRQRGDMEGALAALDESERLGRQTADWLHVAWTLASRGFLLRQRGQTEQSLACYAEADELSRNVGDLIASASIVRGRGHVLVQCGDYNGALRCYAEAEALGRDLHDERTIFQAVGNRGMVLADRGDYNSAMECYQAAETLARRLGDKRGIAINVGNRGILLRDRGEPQQALHCYREAEALNREVGSQFGVAVNLGNRANALADLGRLDEALQLLAEAERLNRQAGNQFLLGLNLGDRAIVLRQQGDFPSAYQLLLQAIGVLENVRAGKSLEYFTFLSTLAEVKLVLGQTEAARRRADAAWQLAEELELSDNHPKLRVREHLATLRKIRE